MGVTDHHIITGAAVQGAIHETMQGDAKVLGEELLSYTTLHPSLHPSLLLLVTSHTIDSLFQHYYLDYYYTRLRSTLSYSLSSLSPPTRPLLFPLLYLPLPLLLSG